MRITKGVDYVLRILICLEGQSSPISMPKMVEMTKISYHNVMKIVQLLTKLEIVETKQGKYGGILLKKNLTDISLKEIIEFIEGPILLSDCFHEDCDCSGLPNCQIKSVLGHVQNQIVTILEDTKIKEMVEVNYE